MEVERLREYFRGGVVQVVQPTPFGEGEEVDYEGLRENTSYLVEKRHYGPMVLTPAGSTGEMYALTDEEWRRVVKAVVDEANGKVPVVPGASHSGTRVAIERSRYAEDVGADGVMVVLPYYHVPDEEGLYQHYKKLADSVEIGIQPYNNPDVSKVYMRPHILRRLVEETTNIVSVKENTPYIPTLYEHIKLVGDKVPILQGRGDWWFAATAHLGVRGYVSGYANFMPEFCIDLLRAGLNGSLNRLREFMERLDPYEEFISRMQGKYAPSTTILPYPYTGSYIMFSVMKATMDILGLRGGHMRLPLVDLKKEDKMELERVVLDRLKLTRIK